MSLSIQFLSFSEGFTHLNEAPVLEISENVKIFELAEPMNKKVTHEDGSVTHGIIRYLLLGKTDKEGTYNVRAFYPNNSNILSPLGLADVRKNLNPYVF
ncbi:hypothetical protein [Acinetobacter bereziniae]|uniref:hypothetical protein n=1 Tax=Acinetobacter bereziniae TaxID=106648 RepID=UPI001250053D|nr:hypothetical protein [Acinetobacter bereziniae]